MKNYYLYIDWLSVMSGKNKHILETDELSLNCLQDEHSSIINNNLNINQKKFLAAVRLSELTGRSIL